MRGIQAQPNPKPVGPLCDSAQLLFLVLLSNPCLCACVLGVCVCVSVSVRDCKRSEQETRPVIFRRGFLRYFLSSGYFRAMKAPCPSWAKQSLKGRKGPIQIATLLCRTRLPPLAKRSALRFFWSLSFTSVAQFGPRGRVSGPKADFLGKPKLDRTDPPRK